MKKILIVLAAIMLLLGCGDGGGGSHSGGYSGPLPTVVFSSYESAPNSNTGIARGNVTSDGGNPPVFERGFCWGTTPNPSKENGTCISTSAGTGPFSEVIMGVLNDNTIVYYMRAFASNPVGTGWSWGGQITLKTR